MKPRSERAPARFHVMAKPTGAICNLDCSDCFYLDNERPYHDGKFRMGDDILELCIRQLDFFRRAAACVERHRRPKMTIEHTSSFASTAS